MGSGVVLVITGREWDRKSIPKQNYMQSNGML